MVLDPRRPAGRGPSERFANGESTGFSKEGSYTRAGSWVMEVGTSSAHIMIPGR